MPQTKEEKNAYNKEYNQTPAAIKSKRISHWKSRGIIVPDNDWDAFYDFYLTITNCQLCKKELTDDKKITHSTRVPHHDHNILDKPNVIAICCQACNANDRLDNTSGEPNVSYCKTKKYWTFQKIIQGKRYYKGGFKTKQEAINYKKYFRKKYN
tara:strand:- start:110 stop:571 length:462 start_codon:yes stop_codon:yes gene_type:complete